MREDRIAALAEELAKVGTRFYLAEDRPGLWAILREVLNRATSRLVAWDRGELLQELSLKDFLKGEGLELIEPPQDPTPQRDQEKDWISRLNRAGIGITGLDYVLATTGTIVIGPSSGPYSKAVSLLPPIHVAIGRPNQIMTDLEELLSTLSLDISSPSLDLVFITGPSRTADIEQTLTMGVHGPLELDLILLK